MTADGHLWGLALWGTRRCLAPVTWREDEDVSGCVCFLCRPWDSRLPDDVQELKLILHMWVALFYSKPRLLSSTRVVVEHSDPKKYVSINTTWDFLEFSDDGEDYFGLEKCPADSRSDPDQTPSSSLDHTTHNQGQFHPADSRTDADGTPAVVDSTVSSSGELPCGEEEPSSTSCPEHADEKDKEPAAIAEEHGHDIPTITKVRAWDVSDTSL